MSADGRRAYLLSLQSAQIFVIDTVFNTVLPTITLSRIGTSIATAPAGDLVYVTFRDTNELAVIDPAAGNVAARIPVGNSPVDVAVTSDGGVAYVANGAATVSVVDLATRTVVATIPIEDRPSAIAIAPDDRKVYVPALMNRMSVIDAATNSVVGRVGIDGALSALAVRPDGEFVYVANPPNRVALVDVVDGSLTGTIPVGRYPAGIAFTPDGVYAYVGNGGLAPDEGSISIIDAELLTVPVTITYPAGTATSPASVAVASIQPPG